MIIESTTPIAALTVGDLKELLRELDTTHKAEKTDPTPDPGRRYVYGLKGIQSLFGCSHLTAQRYKDGFLKPACMQRGRKIVIDADKAMQLFKERKDGND